MELKFKNIIPAFLAGTSSIQSDVWAREYNFSKEEKIIISAQSGKGKSTLLAYLFGIRNSYSGHILFDDKDIRDITLREWSEVRRSKISLVFQELRLLDELSVRDNIALKLKYSSLFSFSDAVSMLERLEVGSFIDKPCKYLSFGQRQRVAIVRSLLQSYEWILMDEPFSHLDDDNAQRCLQLIEEVTEKNKAGYIITCLGDNQYPLKKGRTFNRILNL